jgi:hypothetical protein
VKNAFMPAFTGIHLRFGSPPSDGSPMLPDLSYMSTRFTAGSAAFFMAVTQAAFVPTGSVENDPGSPPPAPLPPPFAPSPKSEPPEPPHASSTTVTAGRKRGFTGRVKSTARSRAISE